MKERTGSRRHILNDTATGNIYVGTNQINARDVAPLIDSDPVTAAVSQDRALNVYRSIFPDCRFQQGAGRHDDVSAA